MHNQTRIRIAALWFYIVAAATLLNSLLLQLSSRFVDLLVGLWLTQMIDAVFLGMRSIEPEGATPFFEIAVALILDALVVLIVLVLAMKISRGSRRAARIAFFGYAIDTAAFTFDFGFSAWSHAKMFVLGWQALTVFAHLAGVVIVFRAWRVLREKSRPQIEPTKPTT